MILLTKCSFGTRPKDGISGKDDISDDDIAGGECILNTLYLENKENPTFNAEFSIPNLSNYSAFYNTFTELKIATKVSTKLTPSYELRR